MTLPERLTWDEIHAAVEFWATLLHREPWQIRDRLECFADAHPEGLAHFNDLRGRMTLALEDISIASWPAEWIIEAWHQPTTRYPIELLVRLTDLSRTLRGIQGALRRVGVVDQDGDLLAHDLPQMRAPMATDKDHRHGLGVQVGHVALERSQEL